MAEVEIKGDNQVSHGGTCPQCEGELVGIVERSAEALGIKDLSRVSATMGIMFNEKSLLASGRGGMLAINVMIYQCKDCNLMFFKGGNLDLKVTEVGGNVPGRRAR